MNGFHFSAGESPSADVLVTFADGEHSVQAWLVRHLGGTDKVDNPAFRAQALEITFEEFTKAFFQAASEEQLRGIGSRIIGNHLGRLRK